MIYKNAKINGEIKDIRIENGVFAEIGKINEDGIDLQGQTVIPGLIDIHTHGAMGIDTMDGKDIDKISEYLLKNGITSWLPTTMTMGFTDIKRVTDIIPETKGQKSSAIIWKDRIFRQNTRVRKMKSISKILISPNLKA